MAIGDSNFFQKAFKEYILIKIWGYVLTAVVLFLMFFVSPIAALWALLAVLAIGVGLLLYALWLFIVDFCTYGF